MDSLQALVMFTVVGSLFAALGLAAEIWGVDSRPAIHDDHSR